MPENTPYQPLSIQQIGSNAKQLINSSPGYWKNWKNDLYREYVMQQATAEQQNAFNVAMWNAENEYNTPANQMRRFQDAGLNPNLIYGQQNTAASAPSAAGGVNFNVAGHRKNALTKQQNTVQNILEVAQIANTLANTVNNLENAKQNRLYTGQLTAKAAVDTAKSQYILDYLLPEQLTGQSLNNRGQQLSNTKSSMNNLLQSALLGLDGLGFYAGDTPLNYPYDKGGNLPDVSKSLLYLLQDQELSYKKAATRNQNSSASLHDYQRTVYLPEQIEYMKSGKKLRDQEAVIKSVKASLIDDIRHGRISLGTLGNAVALALTD